MNVLFHFAWLWQILAHFRPNVGAGFLIQFFFLFSAGAVGHYWGYKSPISGVILIITSTWRGRGLSKSFISRVIIGVTPFRVLITLLVTYLLRPLPLQVDHAMFRGRSATAFLGSGVRGPERFRHGLHTCSMSIL